jgi:hypothetical protein
MKISSLFLGDVIMVDKKPRKKKLEEDVVIAVPIEEEVKIPEPLIIKEEKRTYLVIRVSPSKVIYEVSKDNLSFTRNIWGPDLKVGDRITL